VVLTPHQYLAEPVNLSPPLKAATDKLAAEHCALLVMVWMFFHTLSKQCIWHMIR
jgi:hypothetical protein